MKTASMFMGALVCFALAYITHNFYIDYEEGHLSQEDFIFSWPSSKTASAAARGALLQEWANRKALTAQARRYSELRGGADERLHRDCKQGRDPLDFDCSSSTRYKETMGIIDDADKMRKDVFKKVVAQLAQKAATTPVWSGMIPSKFATAGSISTKARAKASPAALWKGIVLPAGLLLAGIWLLVFAIHSVRRKPAIAFPVQMGRGAPPKYQAPAAEPITQPHASAMVEMLRAHFGADFPVSGGEGTLESPLVITRKVDYVSVEYVVAEHILKSLGEQFAKDKQSLRHVDGRAIDELAYRVKSAGAADWTGIRRFYFDITNGFNELGK